MVINIKIWILLFYSFFCGLKAKKQETGWMNYFLKYLTGESGISEVILLTDSDKQTFPPKVDNIIKTISRKFPTKEFYFANKLLPTSSNFSPDSSIFIEILLFENRNLIREMTKFISQLAQNRRRPKLLIILLKQQIFTSYDDNQNLTYDELLQTVWSDQFLDATILELLDLKSERGNFLPNHQDETATLYYYNPYSNVTTDEKCSPKSIWFPEKLQDLKGYPIKVGFHNYPPDTNVKLNQSGEILSISGNSALKVLTLSETMNFQLVKSFIDNWGVFSCNKEGNLGFHRSLLDNDIHVAALEYPRFSPCDHKLYEFSKGIKMIHISLVVPILPDEFSVLPNTWKIQNGFAVVSLTIFMWGVSHLLRFDSRKWHAIYMLQVVLSSSTPHKPKKLKERIIFASMMWACFFHSSYIYMAFTNVELHMEVKPRLQSIEDVIDLGLQTIIHNNYADMIYNNSESSIKILLDKATKMRILEKDCMMKMIGNKNLTCVSRRDHAEYEIQKHQQKCGKPVMKILDNSLRIITSSTVLAPGSPYAKRFDVLIQRLIETGIAKKWQEISLNVSSFKMEADDSCSLRKSKLDNELSHLPIILVVGYISGTIVFITEILIAKLLKRCKSH